MQLAVYQRLMGLPYLLVGGLATQYYMPARYTVDVDILVLARDQLLIEERLLEGSYQQQGRLSIGDSTWRSPTGDILDLLTHRSQWAEAALQSPNWIADVPVIALPYLVLMKLRAGRMQDLADVTRMLGAADEQALEAVRSTIRLYDPAALDDIESMIVLGKLENQ